MKPYSSKISLWHTIVRKLAASFVHAYTVFIMLLVYSNANLNAGSWGSGYSRFGIGEIRHFPNERSAGMGGTHIALLGTHSINTINPAAWTQINRMRFSISTAYEGYAIKDASSSTFLSGATFNGFAFAIPISMENGFTASAGLTPYNVVNYNVVTHVADTSFSYTLKNIGEGGLSSAHLGVSALFEKDWHVGAKLNYLFGTIYHKTTQDFDSPQYTDARLNRAARLTGATLSLGAIYSGVGDLLGMSESDVVTFGALFTTGTKLSTIQENFYEYTSSGGSITGRDTVLIAEGTSSLPLALGLGVSYTTKERFILAGDFSYQNWGRFDLLGVRPNEMRDSYRLSIGAEILPRKDISASYFEKTAYRFGVFYNATNLRIKGTGINEVGFTSGIGLPMFGETRLTISVEYSIRGTIDIEKDNILRISFTLNSGELWFVRPPEE